MPQEYDIEQLLDLGPFGHNSSYISQYNKLSFFDISLQLLGGKIKNPNAVVCNKTEKESCISFNLLL